MQSDPADRVLALRQLLRERFPTSHTSTIDRPSPAEWAEDSDTGEERPTIEFCPGMILEVVAEHPGCGGALLIGDLLHRATAQARILALVDGKDSFDPDSYGSAACDRLLWLRCHDAPQALQATDLLLRDGNLCAILLDLQLNPMREIQALPSSAWHRFRGLAERSGAALLILTPAPLVTSAHHRFVLEPRHAPAALDSPRRFLAEQSHARLTRRRMASRRLSA
jgi:hypothetical protein